jgi:hypothetical protein
MMAGSSGLFEHNLPQGFHYRENFITEADERVLLDAIAHVAFSDFEMRGVVARRRVAFFGQSYDRGAAGPFPESCCRCAPRLRSGLVSMPQRLRLRWRSSTSIGPARPPVGIATRRSTILSQASRC